MNKTLIVFAALLALTACQKQDAKDAADTVLPVAAQAVKSDFSGDFNALGNEPFWSVQIRSSSIVLERPDAKANSGVYAPPVVDGSSARFSTVSAAGKALEVTLTAEPCVDSMSGFTYAYSATVKSGDETLTGCATRPDAAGPGEGE